MTQVETLGGPIDVDQLGTVYMHEHIILVNREIDANYPGASTRSARSPTPSASCATSRRRAWTPSST